MKHKVTFSVLLGSVLVGFIALGTGRTDAQNDPRTVKRDARAPGNNQGRVGMLEGRGLFATLHEPVTPVEIHHVLFGRPVQIAASEARDESGAVARDPVNLRFASSGVVVGRDNSAFRVDVGDPVSVGDVIIGGVIENAGAGPVLVLFTEGGGPTLRPGERLYIGSSERLVRDADSDGSVVANHHVMPIGGGPGTHCAVCSCTCSCTGGGSCGFTFDTNNSGGDQCGASNGSGCVCSGENGCSGSASACSRVYVPCPPAA